MNTHVRLRSDPLSDEVVVLPDAIARELGWTDVAELEVDIAAGRVVLRPVVEPPSKQGLTVEEVFDMIQRINPYRGPRISDEEIDAAMLDSAAPHNPTYE